MFFHFATGKISLILQNFSLFEDLSFLNPRSHLNKTFKNWCTPAICLYSIRFELKLPTTKLLSFWRLILLSSFFNLKCCMLGCLWIVPNIKFSLWRIRSSVKTDFSSLGLCIFKSSHILYGNFFAHVITSRKLQENSRKLHYLKKTSTTLTWLPQENFN